MASVEVRIIAKNDQGEVTHDVAKVMTKDEMMYCNIGPMNLGTTLFKEMFKKLLKTVDYLQK